MATNLLHTILLFALPASGKSEVRRYLANLPPDKCREEFHVGPTLQLDDYPYVHLMHRIDDELVKLGHKNLFYKGPKRPFQDEWEWAVLDELLSEDYEDLMENRTATVPSAAQLLFDRIDRAHAKFDLPGVMGDIPYRLRKQLAEVLEEECATELQAKNETCSQNLEGVSIVIEAARGGPHGAAFPLTPPVGYASALQFFSERILANACILYVWVDPAESRRKNIARARPDAQGSILHHSVPLEVMLSQYGCDDMEFIISESDKANTVRVDRVVEEVGPDGKKRFRTKTFHLPVGRFDNRKDKTSFIHGDPASWRKEDKDAIHAGLREAFDGLNKAAFG